MKNVDIGARTLDIYSGLYLYNDTLLDINLGSTILIGKAASLASHLRGVQVIDSFEGLVALAGKLRITSVELPQVLQILDEIRYINIVGPKRKPDKIEVLIDRFEVTYDRLGEKWKTEDPVEFEKKMIQVINDLTSNSLPIEKVRNDYNIKDDISIMLEIGEQSGLLRTFQNPDGDTYLFSPLFMEENPQRILSFMNNYKDEQIQNLLNLVNSKPGFPVFDLLKINDPLILEILDKNIFQVPAIVASGGQVNFLFSPFTKVEDKQMLKHARYVVSAVRYGERFSVYSELRSPSRFLQALLDRQYIGKTPHSDIEAQYGVLRDCGLGRIEEIVPGRYRFYLADTDYAKNVVRLAQRILFTDSDFHPDIQRGIIDEAWELRKNLTSYTFNDYIPNLSNLNNIKHVLQKKKTLIKSEKSTKLINSIINKIYSEGEPDVF
ncbi:hypothetical protein H1S01_19100 [Heliobacterium chlorum]|uniref:Uncharacterized protein n=1 Tax=Heliobacterium chlorum TaxID=2698 RepID=A0ABR7T922_HELCL|nr:hypothetical protein [Heliobacterium chlorum]MBC9786565.1 hypothetical protein [Heliobacterium chlorum]